MSLGHSLNSNFLWTLIRLGIALLAMLVTNNAFAQGGPPLVTDDPGTPGDGRWEINTALQYSLNDQIKTIQLPLFDINYGYGDHIQLNMNASWITESQTDSPQICGLSVASVGVKWRFIDEDASGVAVSTFPRVDFHHSLSSENPAVNPPGSRYFLPVEFSKGFGQVGVNPEIGFAAYTQFPSEWVYGLAISYTFEQEREALLEIHGRSVVDSTDGELLFNVGTRFQVVENVNLIATAGRTLLTYVNGNRMLNFYVGVQVHQ